MPRTPGIAGCTADEVEKSPVANRRCRDELLRMSLIAAATLAAIFGRTSIPDAPLLRPGFSPAFVLAGDARDSVAFEADSLVASGEQIYTTLHGGEARHDPKTRVVFFRIRSAGRLAVLVDSAGTPRWSVETARHALVDRRATAPAWPHVIARTTDGFEFPRDWFRRAELEFTRDFGTPVRVTFVAFDSPSREEIARVAALQSLGLRAAPIGSPVEANPRPQPPSPEALRLTVRIVGSVLVDPRSGRVER